MLILYLIEFQCKLFAKIFLDLRVKVLFLEMNLEEDTVERFQDKLNETLGFSSTWNTDRYE